MHKDGIRQARETMNTYRLIHKKEPDTDKVATWFMNDCFYELRYNRKRKEWRLTEYEKTEEVLINENDN